MDVSVIIVNYKTSQLLVPAIDSILDKTEDIVYEIIVVDNHSQDDSERVVHEHYGNRVTYLPLAENVGFGRANAVFKMTLLPGCIRKTYFTKKREVLRRILIQAGRFFCAVKTMVPHL